MESVLSPVVAAASPRPSARMFAPIAADIDETDRILAAALAQYRSPPFGPLIQHMKHYRGKRLRPSLLLLAAKASGAVASAHHVLAAAVEMIHTATLVHDDVLDEAAVRRRLPTVNAEWGNKTSILLGDMLFTHAFHLTSTVDGRACGIIGAATNRVCAGELRQVCAGGNLDLSESDYFAIIEAKTAALTECCCRLGALYAGSSEEVAECVGKFGRGLGLAFQIADDLLDLTGNERSAGKTLGTDLAQRKLTLPLIHCLNASSRGEAEQLREAINANAGNRVMAALERTESLGYARRRAESLARSAKQELECLPRSECRTILESLPDWCIHRER